MKRDNKDKDHKGNGVNDDLEMKQSPNNLKKYSAQLPIHTLNAFEEARDNHLAR